MQEQIREQFGEQALDFALFYNHRGSLRFELSGNFSKIEQFLRAYNRAKSLINFIFRETDTVVICLAFWGSKRYLAHLSIFRSLKKCEIKIPKKHWTWQKKYQEEDELYNKEYLLTRTFICFNLVKSEIPKFLWGTLANELGISPQSKCDLYLFDFETDILVHPYDDRGMDIIGSNRNLLKRTYDEFNEWLLECDRQQMMADFETI